MKYIPNFITCLNLFAGCLACVMAFSGNYPASAIFIYMAAVFDFLDGMAARALHAYSSIGKELDSLADVVSFGMAPGVMLYSLLNTYTSLSYDFIAFTAFLIPIFAALRLAKFNVDTRQSESFLGLAVPANAIFFASFVMNFRAVPSVWTLALLLSLIAVFCFLMLSEIPMFSLKFKNLNWHGNQLRFAFLILSAAVLAIFRLQAFHLIIVLYIVLSIGKAIFVRTH